MFKSKVHFWTLQILLMVAIIYISTKIAFIFQPVGVFISTLFFPILISGFLYYLLNPLVKKLQSFKIPRTISIIIVYAIIIGLISLLLSYFIPAVTKQFKDLADNLPTYANQSVEFFEEMSDSPQFKWVMTQEYVTLEDIEQKLVEFANSLPNKLTNSLASIIGWVTSVTITIVTVPFLLFYMFKDGHKFGENLIKFLPSSYRSAGLKTLKETNKTLASYIQGQVLVALFVGTLSFIGYLIIDLPYALILAVVVVFTNIIPYIGPILGGAPALIIGLFESPMKAILVVIVITVAQQLEGNVLSPLILGKQLKIHPATIIILLLVAGNLAGILGMILAIPTYAVAKTVVVNLANFLRERRRILEEQTLEVE
ncbi:AI-2E family transporter [Bacillus carboniphilus]|uniref:AI-2E family transporter n=1 Tax=Bacillus carboniphilus TaxID=86663 RepID=A0ABN0W3M6_9BACI